MYPIHLISEFYLAIIFVQKIWKNNCLNFPMNTYLSRHLV
jgi:hypothetical protein